MSYLRLGSSGKVLKKKKKERDTEGKTSIFCNEFDEENKSSKPNGGIANYRTEREILTPPPPPPRKNHINSREKQGLIVATAAEEDIFVGEGIDYESLLEIRKKVSNFSEPAYGPVPPPEPPQSWQDMNGYDAMQAQALAGGYQGEWQDYQYAEQLAYSEQYLQTDMQPFVVQAGLDVAQDPRFMSQEEKDQGLGSVFKRDDQRRQQLREKDAREKDPNFISESYSECYPGYQEINCEVVDSDDEDDLSKMDMGGRVAVSSH
ncbi:hypothetical protein Ddye_018737 [Dipteronia dyeriana]|uniref:Protein RED C-terminal domain-containing protein n=1 Tax=Dipteronia dyeriana TaxID=168575 RepID=A0AAD9UBS9_9ROSI|nr:hypothetical protein Ddye_018737 [Dipteronia dyeriana]